MELSREELERLQQDKLYSSRAGSTGGRRGRVYCTHACLLGLARGLPLDAHCPNLALHQTQGPSMASHPISKDTFFQLLREQLDQSLYHDCVPTGKRGAIGYMFRLTLTAYGYTVVGKGAMVEDSPSLRYERSMYDHLSSIQGRYIPVCLGHLGLVRPYAHDMNTKISQFLLLSFVGEHSLYDHNEGRYRDTTAIEQIHNAGVVHNYVQSPNILWSSEAAGFMFISFELADIVTPPKSSGETNPEDAAAEAKGAQIIANRMKVEVQAMRDILAWRRTV
ncbi:MAG: hypothetical protein M1839_008560 [Geoglossum umbratile]|nr:MAG: hypothetical protein M1839_008560 [Geoglossum umbratile]